MLQRYGATECYGVTRQHALHLLLQRHAVHCTAVHCAQHILFLSLFQEILHNLDASSPRPDSWYSRLGAWCKWPGTWPKSWICPKFKASTELGRCATAVSVFSLLLWKAVGQRNFFGISSQRSMEQVTQLPRSCAPNIPTRAQRAKQRELIEAYWSMLIAETRKQVAIVLDPD